MKHLYFCRHGESELNALAIYAGQLDTPLTERGREQAATAGAKARALPIDLIVTSSLSRAQETATIIAQTIDYDPAKIIVNELFIEQSYGSLEGRPWSTRNINGFTDIESDDALTERARAGLAYLQSLEADNVLLVGHGSFCIALMNVLEPGRNHPELANAEIVELT